MGLLNKTINNAQKNAQKKLKEIFERNNNETIMIDRFKFSMKNALNQRDENPKNFTKHIQKKFDAGTQFYEKLILFANNNETEGNVMVQANNAMDSFGESYGYIIKSIEILIKNSLIYKTEDGEILIKYFDALSKYFKKSIYHKMFNPYFLEYLEEIIVKWHTHIENEEHNNYIKKIIGYFE
ncbi:hypothetical protein K9L67_01000 [Candidatus Woesearchaeota archaeon]|nr:hypothetical protein [Candidatus Woesearchaeota archaeon]MCF7900781.1 hypothetical protein [Candidatus Woesearchaeota archaeon]MCF8013083.1 hypothetical protein [Candidatus Woesearchaeota archaeon]